jgi:hypothetical protein
MTRKKSREQMASKKIDGPANRLLVREADTGTEEVANPSGPTTATLTVPSLINHTPQTVDDWIAQVQKMSRPLGYSMRSAYLLADVAVQKSPEGVFDVLARNFDNPGLLNYWLDRVGHGDKKQWLKGKDLIDYLRIVAHRLYRDLSREVGRPVARW